jgi:hypothetical protein
MLENAGFDDVIAVDQTNLVCHTLLITLFYTTPFYYLCFSNKFCLFQFLKTLQMELNALENKKVDFIDDFSEVSFLYALDMTIRMLFFFFSFIKLVLTLKELCKFTIVGDKDKLTHI